MIRRVKEICDYSNEGRSGRWIGKKLGIHYATVSYHLCKLGKTKRKVSHEIGSPKNKVISRYERISTAPWKKNQRGWLEGNIYVPPVIEVVPTGARERRFFDRYGKIGSQREIDFVEKHKTFRSWQ